ncbi:MAG: C40 family peptidase [Candidatus Marinimicrobia bacterium]|nr:C40 family peptidase [Candidatus Neomarinimicrobiota bacterium]MCF7827574.1 C40 family peptidase [Candidatus Neomarinimicrobiota bacterium]MCF7881564.1 C40 family peptidase [Candidatus Neomarinimicrobiota bacterium]
MLKQGILTVLVLSVFFSCAKTSKIQRLNSVVEQTGEKYAADSRVEVWDVTGELDGNGITVGGETTSPEGLEALKISLGNTFPNTQKRYDVIVLPDPALEDETSGLIRVGIAQVRREPSHQSELITQGVLGAPVTLLKKSEDHYYIRMEDGYLGWVDTFSVVTGDSEMISDWNTSSLAVFKETHGTVLTEPMASSATVADILLGARVQVRDRSPRWAFVGLPDGRMGFVPRDDLIPMEDFRKMEPSHDGIANQAKELLGVSYLWGGTTSAGFDCSGFTQTVYRMNGIHLPRDANMQVNRGVEIDTSNGLASLHVGDLLFFGSEPGKITHVGILLGNQEFIHASGMVKINSLDPEASNYNKYRHNTLQTVKRLF